MNPNVETTEKPATLSGECTIGGDMPVVRLGYGAMRITGPGIWGEPASRDNAKAVLRRALELGVNLIDTADAYGPDVSEELIAEALHPYPQGLVIATKGGLLRRGPNDWYPDGRPEHLREALEGSLKRLRVERVDLYQFHRPDPNVDFEASVGALAELRTAGKIRHIGLSNVNAEQLAQAQRITPIVSVQNRYNLTDRSSESMVQLCAQQNIAFFPWAPVGGNERSSLNDLLDALARTYQATPSQIALAWLLRHTPTIVPIPGTGSLAHLEENVNAARIRLSQEDVAKLSSAAAA